MLENGSNAMNAMKKRADTMTPTTAVVEYCAISASREFIACFIQTNVPPHKRVTKNRPSAACCRFVAIFAARDGYF